MKLLSMLFSIILSCSIVAPFGAQAALIGIGKEYKRTIHLERLQLKVEILQNNQVQISWQKYLSLGFEGYAVYRSSIREEVLENENQLGMLLKGDEIAYRDTNAPQGVSYYQVCSLAYPDRYCSEVVRNENTEEMSSESLQGALDIEFIKEIEFQQSPPEPISFEEDYLDTTPLIQEVNLMINDETIPVIREELIPESKTILQATPLSEDGYRGVIEKEDFLFTARRTVEGKVILGWNKYLPYNWERYEIFRSSDQNALTEPDNPTYISISDKKTIVTLDEKPLIGESWYRICSLAYPDQYCSSGVKVSQSKELSEDLSQEESQVMLKMPSMEEEEEIQLIDEEIISNTKKEFPIALQNTQESKLDYFDIRGHDNEEAIMGLLDEKILRGYYEEDVDALTFKPNQTINRAEFLKIIVEARYRFVFAFAYEYTEHCFTDITADEEGNLPWYAEYACFAKQKGLIDGYSDGSFRANEKIILAEAAAILTKVFSLELPKRDGAWYESAILALQKRNYLPSSVTIEYAELTRGEIAELIWRLMKRIQNKPSSIIIPEK